MRKRFVLSIAVLTLIACKGSPEAPAAGEPAAGEPAAKLPELAPVQGEIVEPRSPATCAAPTGGWYLHLSDIHLGANVPTQQPGGDTSMALWEATKAALRERLGGPNPPAFILYTGDLPDHTPDRGEQHTTNITSVLADLSALAGEIPFLYMPGNNDSLDWDYASFTSAAGQTPLDAAGWPTPTLNVESEGVPSQGYYSTVPIAGLRVIAFNSVIMSASYPCSHQGESSGACANSQDQQVDAQLSWLSLQLDAASKAGQKVLLAMHIPPGIDAYSSPQTMWAQQAWQDRLLATLADSPSEIVGLAYGHTHMDELRRLYDASGELELIGLSAPGITPGHGNNPGFKAISYDAEYRLTDALTWYAVADNSAAPVYTYGADTCYHYAEVFGCDRGQDLRTCLGAQEVCALAKAMDDIFQVENGAPSYATAPGIDVRPGGGAPASCPSAP